MLDRGNQTEDVLGYAGLRVFLDKGELAVVRVAIGVGEGRVDQTATGPGVVSGLTQPRIDAGDDADRAVQARLVQAPDLVGDAFGGNPDLHAVLAGGGARALPCEPRGTRRAGRGRLAPFQKPAVPAGFDGANPVLEGGMS